MPTTVQDVMTQEVGFVREATTIKEVVGLLRKHGTAISGQASSKSRQEHGFLPSSHLET